ncbi:MAG: hypothetical protein IME93_02410 [Proteobacteria bacterium]|nr:hypothetical protein [Pseudomonadota bacterium]
MAQQLVYKVDDSVFYPSAGVGVVEAIEDVYIGGRLDQCYVIRIEVNQITVKVPVDNMEATGIRPLLETGKVKELYQILEGKSSRRVTGGNWTERCKDLDRRINRGTCLQLAEVVRDLLRWKEESGLSFEEAMLLETACGYLARELATVRGISPDIAADDIRDHVGIVAAA